MWMGPKEKQGPYKTQNYIQGLFGTGVSKMAVPTTKTPQDNGGIHKPKKHSQVARQAGRRGGREKSPVVVQK